jgi:FKBP-type peptidyl-prolyl cis-trans isomerase 2
MEPADKMTSIPKLVKRIALSPMPLDEIQSRQRAISRQLLETSKYMDAANFTQFHPNDLRQLYCLYDELFFEGEVQSLLGDSPLTFRISSRMTSSGGTTARRIFRNNPTRPHYEITISSTLLFDTFADVQREVTVTGLKCRSRLEALQRIFEHELVHLLELLIWKRSACSQARFQAMAFRAFGHRDHRHALVTPRERARAKFGLRPGMRVSFEMHGKRHVGVINRITQRATVLVENPRGRLFSDGRRYSTYYIPLEQLVRLP